jgi:hypothetical protein
MHVPTPSLRTRARRTVAVVVGLAMVLVVGLMPVAAFDPSDLFELEPSPPPLPARVLEPPTTPRPVPVRTPVVVETVGFDVSWPQCNDELPASFGYAIVGVNRGRTYSENDCLVEQLEWAGRNADVYLNTGNPGPHHSMFWPVGTSGPVTCDRRDDDSHECAYLYGWNAAADGYARVLAAHVALGWADSDADRVRAEGTWWLDVETANSWRIDRTLNVAALHGAVDFLESMGVEEVGFYSTPLLWWRVTRGTDEFADYPAWHAGGRTRTGAEDGCEGEAFTGGELRMVQWVEGGLDRNVSCASAT